MAENKSVTVAISPLYLELWAPTHNWWQGSSCGSICRLEVKDEVPWDFFPSHEHTPRSKYMAQSPKGRLIQGLYKPIHGNCAIYFTLVCRQKKMLGFGGILLPREWIRPMKGSYYQLTNGTRVFFTGHTFPWSLKFNHSEKSKRSSQRLKDNWQKKSSKTTSTACKSGPWMSLWRKKSSWWKHHYLLHWKLWLHRKKVSHTWKCLPISSKSKRCWFFYFLGPCQNPANS